MKLLDRLKIDEPKQIYFIFENILLQARLYIHKYKIKREKSIIYRFNGDNKTIFNVRSNRTF